VQAERVNELVGVGQIPEADEPFAGLLLDVASDEAPRLFAIMEEYGEQEDVRAAGYGLAFDDRVEVDAVEGGFRLSSESVERALTLFAISTRDESVRRLHLVWLDAVDPAMRRILD
jgi:hypothetical protein